MSAPLEPGSPWSSATRSESGVSTGQQRVEEDARRIDEAGPVHLLMAGTQDAVVHLGRVARSLRRPWARVSGWAMEASPDAGEALRLAMRETVVFQRRRLARVFAGRITRLSRVEQDRAPRVSSSSNVPPSLLEVELETEEERRTVHLESAWAWNLHAMGVRVGDVVQIDMQDPLVTVLEDTGVLEGRVLDDRDHLQQVSLGAMDRAHAGPEARAAGKGAEEEAELISRAARADPVILGTGERVPTGAEARVETDRWVRRQLSEKHTALVPGFVGVVDAARLPERAWAVLHASAGAPAVPGIVLCEADPDPFNSLVDRFPGGDRWDPLG